MMRNSFDLIIWWDDLNSVLSFAIGRVLGSRCSSLAVAALLIEAAELAILACKDDWPFSEDKETALDGIRSDARVVALKLYHNGGEGNGFS